jgi:hypothetical protein
LSAGGKRLPAESERDQNQGAAQREKREARAERASARIARPKYSHTEKENQEDGVRHPEGERGLIEQ